jgi:tetratricopeptide (TPR) repeat protein
MTRGNTIAAKIALALLAPIVALGLIEGALRLAHVGLPVRFLVPAYVDGRACWVDNPFYGYRFFPPELARNPAPISVERAKPAGRMRIAVLGESAAQGDPLLEFGTPRLLEKMLNEMAGADRYEVVNAAMTAINSPVIADIARDLQACAPDVVLLYVGNNEVIGPFGPGTVFTPLAGATRLAAFRVRLTRLRLAQWLQPHRSKTQRNWAGLDLFAGIYFPDGDPRLEPMVAAYRRNLESIVDTCRNAGARVILSTMAVNLADCPPFGAEEPTHLAAADRAAWQAQFDQARAALASSRWEAARAACEKAMGLFDRHAGLAYCRAQAEQGAGHLGAAGQFYRRARDLDTQRFRADRRINAVIRDVAKKNGVELVDAETAFAAATPAVGVPGEDLFLDHVHFTFAGTWQLAGLFAAAIRGAEPAGIPSLETCRRLAFFNPWAERQQAAAMLERRRRPPLQTQPGNDRQIARLYEIEARCSARIAEMPLGDVEQAYRQLAATAPRDFFIPFQWGTILTTKNRWEEAAPILTNALRQVPFHFEARVLPAVALCQIGQPEEAARILVGAPTPQGRYLAENTLAVLQALEGSGRLDEARRFRAELLQLAPRFPLRRAIETYPIGKPKT